MRGLGNHKSHLLGKFSSLSFFFFSFFFFFFVVVVENEVLIIIFWKARHQSFLLSDASLGKG
jgi:hypothetical protein